MNEPDRDGEMNKPKRPTVRKTLPPHAQHTRITPPHPIVTNTYMTKLVPAMNPDTLQRAHSLPLSSTRAHPQRPPNRSCGLLRLDQQTTGWFNISSPPSLDVLAKGIRDVRSLMKTSLATQKLGAREDLLEGSGSPFPATSNGYEVGMNVSANIKARERYTVRMKQRRPPVVLTAVL